MSGYDSWLEAPAHDREDEQEHIEQRIEELMVSKDYDPTDVSHIAEAISEASRDDQDTIRDYITQRDWAKLGQKLYVMSYDYMEHFAESEAQREVSNGL
jgi:hypothetical protein